MADERLNLFLVRHAQSGANAWWMSTIGNGMSEEEALKTRPGPDSPLTDLGRRQARLFGEWFAARYEPTAIYCSRLLRSRQTAGYLAEACRRTGAEVDIEALNEYSGAEPLARFGAAEQPYADAQRLRQPVPPEVYVEFYRTVTGALESILSAHPVGTIVVVSHGLTMLVTLRALLGAYHGVFWHNNTGWDYLYWYHGRWNMEGQNRVDHLILTGESELLT